GVRFFWPWPAPICLTAPRRSAQSPSAGSLQEKRGATRGACRSPAVSEKLIRSRARASGARSSAAGRVRRGVASADGWARAAATGAHQLAAQPVESAVDRALFHGRARTRLAQATRPHPLGRVEGEVDRADRVLLRAAAGTGETGDGQTVIGA